MCRSALPAAPGVVTAARSEKEPCALVVQQTPEILERGVHRLSTGMTSIMSWHRYTVLDLPVVSSWRNLLAPHSLRNAVSRWLRIC